MKITNTELDAASWKFYNRPFAELDADKAKELREELEDGGGHGSYLDEESVAKAAR